MKLRFSLVAAVLAMAALPSLPQAKKASPPKSLRLYVFDCGNLNIADPERYELKRAEMATNMMSVPCFLVSHPRGNMIWDAGVIPDGDFKPGGAPATIRYATSTKTLLSQLAAAGFTPADVNYLALSHFHWDHVANANSFASATWLVRKVERDTMFAEPPSTRTEPANFSKLKTSKTTLIDKDDYDVFGDGTVVIKSTPGHSPGHQVLYLKLAQTGGVVLSGDLYHYPEERKLNRYPNTEHNLDQTKASRASLETFLKQSGAQLWIEHDFTANAKLKKSPAYYE